MTSVDDQTIEELRQRAKAAEERADKWKSIADGLFDYYYLGQGMSSCVKRYIDATND